VIGTKLSADSPTKEEKKEEEKIVKKTGAP